MALFTRKSTAAPTVTEAPAVDPALAALTGTYTIDPSHSSIGFTVRHAMVTNVRGSFGEHEGTLVVDGTDPANSSASIDVKIASIDTGIADRDGHLVSGDFF
ncbi:polyisoprenoid-binding protein, partial [Streptomyces sp. SID7499]|nr:polyisoprenoid-binding protein [Streptomyces sp. SID7499]